MYVSWWLVEFALLRSGDPLTLTVLFCHSVCCLLTTYNTAMMTGQPHLVIVS